jgi:NAD-dependent deacetylase
MSRCEDPHCATEPFHDNGLYQTAEEIPKCSCGSRIRPHIVWFGEVPFELHMVKRKVQACDLFVTVGSSGAVYPAAGFVREVRYRQSMAEPARSVYVGLELPDNADEFDEVRLGKAGDLLPTLFDLR